MQGRARLRARSGSAPSTPPTCSHCPGTGSSRLLRPPATLTDHRLRWLLLTPPPCFPASSPASAACLGSPSWTCAHPNVRARDGHRCPGRVSGSSALTGPALPGIPSAVGSGTCFAHPQEGSSPAPGSEDRIESSEWRPQTGEPLRPHADSVPLLCGPQPFLSSLRDGKVWRNPGVRGLEMNRFHQPFHR